MDLQLQMRVMDFYAHHSEILSDDKIEQWPDLYTDECLYKLISRVNFDRQLPLGTILCESRGALIDRVTAIRNTMFHRRRSIVHTVSNVRLLQIETDNTLLTRSMFSVWQTLTDGQTHLQMAGRSFDRLAFEGDTLQFRERIAVFDSELVPGSIVYPI